jgi:hypothetical protein
MFRSILIGLAAAAVASAAATGGTPISKPDHVSATCRKPANAWGCRVALRYLAALDLDRTQEACSLLEPQTLAAAGGMAGCRNTLAKARGIRISYSLTSVRVSPFGRSIYFSTRVEGRSELMQAMIVTPRRRILMIVPAPCSAC